MLTCLGGNKQKLSFKKTKNENHKINNFFDFLNKKRKIDIRNYTCLTGSDEKQYNSSNLNLPVGQICRTEYLQYKEYHNSLDNKKFMNISKILDSVNQLEKFIFYFDKLYPKIIKQKYFDVFLSKYGLYDDKKRSYYPNNNNFVTLPDGKTRIIDIAINFNFDLDKTH